MTQDRSEKKFIVFPQKQLLTMAVISMLVAYVLHNGVIGNSSSVALSGAVALSVGVIAAAFLISMVPAGIFWLVKRHLMPGFVPLVWIVWAGILGFMVLRIVRFVNGG